MEEYDGDEKGVEEEGEEEADGMTMSTFDLCVSTKSSQGSLQSVSFAREGSVSLETSPFDQSVMLDEMRAISGHLSSPMSPDQLH